MERKDCKTRVIKAPKPGDKINVSSSVEIEATDDGKLIVRERATIDVQRKEKDDK